MLEKVEIWQVETVEGIANIISVGHGTRAERENFIRRERERERRLARSARKLYGYKHTHNLNLRVSHFSSLYSESLYLNNKSETG